MPLGFERLNEKTQRPNKNVNFIKPLEGLDKNVALDFLSRVAAISTPIMRENHLYVMSLEEFPPNREFWGRNFNNGEAIQLVLKSPSTGQWLPFRFVQMVFMHELAHCKQMNHSRAFWQLRNAYSAELRELWNKNYYGDGLWGRGQSLYDGQYTHDSLSARDVEVVRNLCGGTYRGVRGRRKRKPQKPQVSYAERKQRRIEKKFGVNGVSLGDDEAQRSTLEKGKSTKGKPRVAGSNRGRELRAAALLDRLEKTNSHAVRDVDEENDSDETLDHDLDYEEFGEEALDPQGNQILDSEGHRLVKVCEDEDPTSDPNAMNELKELGQFSQSELKADPQKAASSSKQPSSNDSLLEMVSGSQAQPVKKETPEPNGPHLDTIEDIHEGRPAFTDTPFSNDDQPFHGDPVPLAPSVSNHFMATSNDCPICSLTNESNSLTCAACGHVLDPDNFPDYWHCSSAVCRESAYLNPGDNGVCGICGGPKIQAGS